MFLAFHAASVKIAMLATKDYAYNLAKWIVSGENEKRLLVCHSLKIKVLFFDW